MRTFNYAGRAGICNGSGELARIGQLGLRRTGLLF